MRAAFVLALLLTVVAAPAGAVLPDEMLADPVLEARARDISKNLRCLVCQNQSIDDSDAGLARDLRIIVRERLVAGDSDGEVIDFVVDRYGDFVLLNPPFKATTYVLWIGPAVIGAFGLLAVVVFFRRRRAQAGGGAPAPLSDEEKMRLDALIEDRSE
jgi:cytochrome c-type biogenesis protein CcmH